MQESPDLTFTRAHLPEVLFPSEIAAALGITPPRAAVAIESGALGPCFFVDARPAVLRSDFLETVRIRAAQGDPTHREVLSDREASRG